MRWGSADGWTRSGADTMDRTHDCAHAGGSRHGRGGQTTGHATGAARAQDTASGGAWDAVLSRLDGVIGTGDGRWSARCPAHDDRSPSLSLRDAGDRLLIHCHAGCHPEDVLRALGLGWRDLHTGDRWAAADHAGVMAASHLAARERARRAARIGYDPAHERLIVQYARDDMRAGRELSIESRARVQIAVQRLRADADQGGRSRAA
jgi:hypothetical protein